MAAPSITIAALREGGASQPDLSIIIVNWNSCAFVKQCLRSIDKYADGLACEVLVIDNASYDGCGEMMKDRFPGAIFIQSDANLGFARANNLGFQQSRGRNILFLNPDTEIQEGALQKMLAHLESDPRVGMVGARLLNSDLSLQATCITAVPSILNQALDSALLRKWFPKWRIWGKAPLFSRNPTPARVEAISGACMLAKREVVEQIGGFTADYFMYSEDMDLSVKVSKTGQMIYYVPEATIVHHAAGSSSTRKETHFSSIMIRESVVRFMELHRGAAYARFYRAIMALIAALRIALLVLLLPSGLSASGRRFLSHAFGKWCGILAWALGLNRWVAQTGTA